MHMFPTVTMITEFNRTLVWLHFRILCLLHIVIKNRSPFKKNYKFEITFIGIISITNLIAIRLVVLKFKGRKDGQTLSSYVM